MFGVERIRVPECRQDHCQMPVVGDWDPWSCEKDSVLVFGSLESSLRFSMSQKSDHQGALQGAWPLGVLLHGSRALLSLGSGPQCLADYWNINWQQLPCARAARWKFPALIHSFSHLAR